MSTLSWNVSFNSLSPVVTGFEIVDLKHWTRKLRLRTVTVSSISARKTRSSELLLRCWVFQTSLHFVNLTSRVVCECALHRLGVPNLYSEVQLLILTRSFDYSSIMGTAVLQIAMLWMWGEFFPFRCTSNDPQPMRFRGSWSGLGCLWVWSAASI